MQTVDLFKLCRTVSYGYIIALPIHW